MQQRRDDGGSRATTRTRQRIGCNVVVVSRAAIAIDADRCASKRIDAQTRRGSVQRRVRASIGRVRAEAITIFCVHQRCASARAREHGCLGDR